MKPLPKNISSKEASKDFERNSQLSLADELFFGVLDPKERRVSETKVFTASGNVINIRIDTPEQAKSILKSLREQVGKLPPPPSPDKPLIEVVSHWFEHELKSDNERLFAFALSIFSGVSYITFINIFNLILADIGLQTGRKKSRSNVFVKDDILLNTIKAKTVRDDERREIIVFENDYYSGALLNVVCQNYKNLLNEILSSLKKIVEEFSEWEIRSRVASAVATVARTDFTYVQNHILAPWAIHQEPQVRSTASFTLAILFNEKPYRQATMSIIKHWTSDQGSNSDLEWRYRWTVASSLKYINIELENENTIEWIDSNLKSLAEFNDIRVADAVIHTILVLYLKYTSSIVHMLKAWLAEDKHLLSFEKSLTRDVVAILAFITISSIDLNITRDNANKKNLLLLIQESESGRGDAWELAVISGIRALELHVFDQFNDLLVSWIQSASEDTNLQNCIKNLIVDIYLNTTPHSRIHVLNKIRNWKQSKNDYITNFAISTYLLLEVKVGNIEIDSLASINVRKTINSITLTPSVEHRLTPEYLTTIVSPFLNAVANIQYIIDDIQKHEFTDVFILSITQNSPVGVSLEGVSDVLRLIAEIFDKGKRERSKKMEEYLLQEKRLELEKKRLEHQEMNIHLAKASEELKKLKIENAKAQFELESEITQASINMVERVAPQLSENDKMIYVGRLLKPVGVLMASGLDIAINE